MVPLLHLRHGHFNVLLPCARDEEFLGLRITKEAQHGIFFHQLVNTWAKLVFIGASLRLDRECDGGLWQFHARILNRRRLVAQRVASQSVFQLSDCPNIARVQLGHGHSGLPLHDGNVRQFLLCAAGEVLQ